MTYRLVETRSTSLLTENNKSCAAESVCVNEYVPTRYIEVNDIHTYITIHVIHVCM